MRFSHIEEDEHGLRLRCGVQLCFKPGELLLQAPGVAGKVEALEWRGQHSPSLGGAVEPFNGASPECAVTQTAKAFDQIGPLELVALLTIAAGMAREGHPE